MFQVGSEKTAKKSPKAIKRHLRSLSWLSRGSWAPEIFSSILSGTGNDEGRNSRSIPGSKPGVTSRILGFWSCVSLHNTEPAGNRWGTPVSNGKKDLCAGVSRNQWKSFKWVLNGEKDKPGSLEKSLGAAQQCLLCTSEVLWSAISVDVGDGESSNSRDGRVIDVLETVEKVKNDHIGINNLPHKRGVFARVCSSEGRNWVCLHNLNSTQL